MLTYAILGASGYTGRSILNLLLKDPNNTVNCYVRSKSKLLGLFPSLEADKSVQIFDGPLNDIPLIASCVSPGVNTVFYALGGNESVPGMRIAQDGA
jgi:N-acetyl-gamma-glutamylphosphate reductase